MCEADRAEAARLKRMDALLDVALAWTRRAAWLGLVLIAMVILGVI